MYCLSCGKEIDDSSKYCPFCGNAIKKRKGDGQSFLGFSQAGELGEKEKSEYHEKIPSSIAKDKTYKQNPFAENNKRENNRDERSVPRDYSSIIKEKRYGTKGNIHSMGTNGQRVIVASIAASIAAIIVIVFLFVFVSRRMVDEPCDWCHSRPTMAFKTSDGSMAYVCSECRKTCTWCGKRATKHYENMLGMIVFVCDECYKDVTGD